MPDRFRRASGADVDMVRAIVVRSMGYWPRDPAYLEEAERLMSIGPADLERDEAWILEDEVGPIGFYRLSIEGERAEIEEFHLEPGRIGHGYGRRMFDHGVARATERGVRNLEWSCDANALGFYLAMGGQVTGTVPSGIEGDEPLTEMAVRIG